MPLPTLIGGHANLHPDGLCSGALLRYLGDRNGSLLSLSSYEAEIVEASTTAQEVVHNRQLLSQLGFALAGPTSMATTNTAARAIVFDPEHHSRLKHVERRHLFVRECVENGHLVVPYVKSADSLADYFTIPLPHKQFFAMRANVSG